MENIENIDVLKAEIKSILAFKAKDGATFTDIKGKFWNEELNISTKAKVIIRPLLT